MTTTPPLKAYYGCLRHKVGTAEVNARWAMPIVATEVLLGMCRCCGGPLLLEGFDSRGVGYGPGLCSHCPPPVWTGYEGEDRLVLP